MPNSKKQNAPGCGGVQVTKRAGGVTSIPKDAFLCDEKHISNLRAELAASGLRLKDTSGQTQCETLLRVLKHVGPKGINTLEGVGLGYLRIAPRIQELEARGWVISSLRERIIGADGLPHDGIARYCLIGRASDHQPAQATLNLEGV
jgi:hypothetical protein